MIVETEKFVSGDGKWTARDPAETELSIVWNDEGLFVQVKELDKPPAVYQASGYFNRTHVGNLIVTLNTCIH